ncbi:GntR family transcriptional regulator [Ramlibacter sp.]|uniref:GntR family transcriptional regulator n=1 Tax=Ramlibacter sp. TaxID=1917967 RepID=UPI002626AB97|nr:GntR family transcriptional regulator [Ramlibacter sp.]MDB5957594.1 yvoA 1 [Ramlibacter sp.]
MRPQSTPAQARRAPAAAQPVRYWNIADQLRHEIEQGRYKPGERLPTEEQLLEHFGVSRHTMREALRVLTEEGLIARRPRAGSTVIATTAPRQFTQRLSSVQELLNYPNTVRKSLSAKYVAADHELAVKLRCAVGTSWFRLHSLRLLEGSTTPVAQTDIYVAPEFAGVTRHRKHLLIPVVDQIAELHGVHADSTDVEISADLMPAATARLLQVPPGSASLNVVRRYADAQGRVFEVTVTTHAAQRYTYSFHLEREAPAARKRPAHTRG